MDHHKKNSSRWLLTRQRFHIADTNPPAPSRNERAIGAILLDILQEESATEACPPAIQERWPLIIGEQIAKHTTPSGLHNGILTVDADHPGWLAEIRRIPKQRLLKKTESIPGIANIKDIRFRLDPAIQTKRKTT